MAWVRRLVLIPKIRKPKYEVFFFSKKSLTNYCHLPFFARSGSDWLKVTPVGIRRMLNWVKFTYGDFPIYITENGVSDRNGSLQDEHRIFYYKHYINNVFKGQLNIRILRSVYALIRIDIKTLYIYVCSLFSCKHYFFGKHC